MTRVQLNEAAKAAREYRARHPKKAKQASKDWKARNPDWWKGRKYVQLLTSALVRGNAKSKVFRDAGMTMNEWIDGSIVGSCLHMIELGFRLVPVESWREFDLNDPEQVKAFLAPENFKLVSK